MPVAEAALDYGATGWALFRNTDGLLDFTQYAFFPDQARLRPLLVLRRAAQGPRGDRRLVRRAAGPDGAHGRRDGLAEPARAGESSAMRARGAVAAARRSRVFLAPPALARLPRRGAAEVRQDQRALRAPDRHARVPAQLAEKGLLSEAEILQIAVSDPERNPFGSLCVQHMDGCAGDVRFYDWDKTAGNIRRGPILWTARSGATISGHVWATSGGAARKPGVVITNGSVQAPEQLYWAQAAALARAGYVVLTWDPQTQGRSDGPGEAPTQNENSTPQSVGRLHRRAPRTRSTSSSPPRRRRSSRATPRRTPP